MQEFFYEESANYTITNSKKTRYFLTKIFSIVFFICAVIWGFFAFYGLEINDENTSLIIWFIILILPSIAFIALGVVCIFVKNNTYRDYDYTIVTDSVRISMVKRGVKRVPVLQFSTYHIEKVGRVYSDTYNSYEENVSVRRRILTDNETPDGDKEFFYLVVNYNSEKQLLIFECTKKFVANILKTTRRTVLEKDFK